MWSKVRRRWKTLEDVESDPCAYVACKGGHSKAVPGGQRLRACVQIQGLQGDTTYRFRLWPERLGLELRGTDGRISHSYRALHRYKNWKHDRSELVGMNMNVNSNTHDALGWQGG